MVPEPKDPYEEAIEDPLKKQRFRFARNLCDDFKRADADNNGAIDPAELKAYYEKRANESGLHVKRAMEGIKLCSDLLKNEEDEKAKLDELKAELVEFEKSNLSRVNSLLEKGDFDKNG